MKDMKSREMAVNFALVSGSSLAWMLVFLVFRWFFASAVALLVILASASVFVGRRVKETKRQRRELEQAYAEVMAKAMNHAVIKWQ